MAPGKSRPKSSVMRWVRWLTIVAPRWCGLVTTLATSSVSAGYGSDGSRTPITVALREPRRTVLPITVASRLSDVLQKRWVRTATGAARGPSSAGPIKRPSTGRRPITSK